MKATDEDRSAMSERGVRRFGEPHPGATTRERPGAYAIVVEGDRVLVVDDGRRFFLPGGGLEADEQPLDALRRELREETGHDLGEAVLFQRARQWVLDEATGEAVDKDCSFFVVQLGERASHPLGHEYVARWAPREAALDLMAEDASRWALSVALCATAIVSGLGTHIDLT